MKPVIIGFFAGLLLPLSTSVSADQPWLISVSIIVGASLVLVFGNVWKQAWWKSVTAAPWLVPSLLAALLGSVMAVESVRTYWLHTPGESLLGLDLVLTVKIEGVPEVRDSYTRFRVTVIDCESCPDEFASKQLQLNWYGPARAVLEPLDVWRLVVRLKPVNSFRNPHSFDRVAWAVQRGIHASGYVNAKAAQTKLSSHDGFNLHLIRMQLAERLTAMTNDDQHLSLIHALTVGIKTSIEKETMDTLRQTGTAHLVAISGLHVSLFAVFGFWFGRFLSSSTIRHWLVNNGVPIPSIPIDGYRFAIVMSLVFATVYAALAGFALPTQRALIMVIVWATARLVQRPPATDAALLLAMLVVLLLEPLSPLGAGFWLSFGTVALIVYLHRGHIRAYPPTIVARLTGMGRTHILLGLLLMPITMWFFQSAVLVAPLANLVAIPVVSLLIVPLAMSSVVFSLCLPSLSHLVLTVCQWCIAQLLGFLQWCQAMSLSAPAWTLPDLEHVVLAMFGLMLLLAPRGLGLRIPGLLLIAPALVFSTHGPRTQGVELHVLDVGQGLAALILTKHSATLFDTGGGFPSAPLVERVVLPYLRGQGRHRLDTLVVSHGDNDHAAGVEAVLARFPGVSLLHSPALDIASLDAATKASSRTCRAGDTWVQDDVWFAFLHPGTDDHSDENDQSCVLLVFVGQSRLLLTGDIEALAEQRLLRRLAADFVGFPVTVMLAPHHGSRSSSSPALVETLKPDHVVFPAGNRNRYGFPHAEVQLRYKLVGAKSYVTGRDGVTVFRLDEAGLREPPQTWWNAHRRLWHRK